MSSPSSSPRRSPREHIQPLKYGLHAPHRDPVCLDDRFTFERAAKSQCETGLMRLEGAELAYFQDKTTAVCKGAVTLLEAHGESQFDDVPTLRALAEKPLDCKHLTYEQLERVEQQPWMQLPDAPGEYATVERDPCDNGQLYCVGPDGDVFKVKTNVHALASFKLLMGDDAHGVEIKPVRMSESLRALYPYCTAKKKATVLKLTYGPASNVTGTTVLLSVWPESLLKWEKQAKRVRVEDEEAADEPLPFRMHDGRIQAWKGQGKKGKYKNVANFELVKVLATYAFTTDAPPIYRLLVRAEFGGMTDVHLIPHKKTEVQDIGTLTVELFLEKARCERSKNVSRVFSIAHNRLLLDEHFQGEQMSALLSQWFDEHGFPPQYRATTLFGRQPDTDIFVFFNACYRGGEIKTAEQAKFVFMPPSKNKESPHPLENIGLDDPMKFPNLVIIPQPWVRCWILSQFYNVVMPAEMQRNLIVSKAAIAVAVSQLHWHVWPQVLTNGSPSGYMKSQEGQTGKSLTLSAISGLMGWHCKPSLGACMTEPAAAQRMAKVQSCNTMLLDEIVQPTADSYTFAKQSAVCKHVVHLAYDGTSRDVYQKSDGPQTGFMSTSNVLANEGDSPFMQRFVLLVFKSLQDLRFKPDLARWNAFCKLLSACQMDLEQLPLYEGKIDVAPIEHLTEFLQKALNVKQVPRLTTLWAITMHFMILLEVASGANEFDAIFKWLPTACARQTDIANATASVLDGFLLLVHETKQVMHVDPKSRPDDTIHFHNYRTDQRRVNDVESYVTMHVPSILAVLKKRTHAKQYTLSDLRRAVDDKHDVAAFGKGRFYDTKFGFPPARMNEECNYVVLEEAQLASHQLTQKASTLYIKETYLARMIDGYERDADVPVNDYKTIIVGDAFTGNYNLYESVLDGSWFGYRCFNGKVYYEYCGFGNKTHFHTAPYHDQDYVTYCYDNLLKVYGFEAPPENIPLPVRVNPFNFRNSMNDHQMPDDEGSKQILEELEVEQDYTMQNGDMDDGNKENEQPDDFEELMAKGLARCMECRNIIPFTAQLCSVCL